MSDNIYSIQIQAIKDSLKKSVDKSVYNRNDLIKYDNSNKPIDLNKQLNIA